MTDDGVQRLLADPRFELMPFDSFGEQMEHLPGGATVAITTSPTLGLDATLEWTETAADHGFEVVPHVAARYVRDADHLDDVAGPLKDAGVTDLFVPGGDRDEPVGEYGSVRDLLSALTDLGYSFEEVGITGYPEAHEFLDDGTLADATSAKEPYVAYIVTQLCYDPGAVIDWVAKIRNRGIDLPVVVRIPGVVNYQRLVRISRKVGVGDSVRFLRKTTGITDFVRQPIGSRGGTDRTTSSGNSRRTPTTASTTSGTSTSTRSTRYRIRSRGGGIDCTRSQRSDRLSRHPRQ